MNSRIAIISGTDRPNSYALRVSTYIRDQFLANGTDAVLVDLQEYPTADVAGGRYDDDIPSVDAFNKTVLESDGMVFVVPEYNGSFPGILKLFIDYLPFPSAFKGVPIAFVGEASGAFGALRAVEQLQMVAAYRMAFMYPERVFINRVKDNFDEQTGPKIPIQNELMQNLIKGFAEFVSDRKEKALTNS
jgi:NAD(P)H-dependent FMN reductase